MPDPSFEATVKNLLNMKPKPHDEDSGDRSGQSDSPAAEPPPLIIPAGS